MIIRNCISIHQHSECQNPKKKHKIWASVMKERFISLINTKLLPIICSEILQSNSVINGYSQSSSIPQFILIKTKFMLFIKLLIFVYFQEISILDSLVLIIFKNKKIYDFL
jgi:hypothetical protein